MWRQARDLRQVLEGRNLTRGDLRVPAHATAQLVDWYVPSVRAKGKHLLVDLSRAPSEPPRAVLHTTLGMDGSWRIFESGRRLPLETKCRPAARRPNAPGQSLSSS